MQHIGGFILLDVLDNQICWEEYPILDVSSFYSNRTCSFSGTQCCRDISESFRESRDYFMRYVEKRHTENPSRSIFTFMLSVTL